MVPCWTKTVRPYNEMQGWHLSLLKHPAKLKSIISLTILIASYRISQFKCPRFRLKDRFGSTDQAGSVDYILLQFSWQILLMPGPFVRHYLVLDLKQENSYFKALHWKGSNHAHWNSSQQLWRSQTSVNIQLVQQVWLDQPQLRQHFHSRGWNKIRQNKPIRGQQTLIPHFTK
jgi:hypothetical protein